MAVTGSYVTQASSTSNATTYTFSATATGTAAADRINPVAATVTKSSGNNTAIADMTINAVQGVMRVQRSTFSQAILEIWDALNPTGTSGDIVVTAGEAQVNCNIGVWAVYGASTTPHDSGTNNGTGASVSISDVTIPTDGFGIFSWREINNGACTWTNADERYDVTVEGSQHSGADTSTPGTPTVTADGATGSQVIIGLSYAPHVAHSIVADVDSYAVTGQATTPLHARKLTADAGTLGITGTAASPEHGRLVDAGVSSYALTGQDSSLVLSGGGSFSIVANPDSYAVTGSTASPLHAWKVDAAPDSYAITGVTAALKHGWKVAAAAGSMAISGSDAAVRKDWRVTAAAGSYGISGTAASPELGRLVTALASSYGISGKIASLIWDAFVGEGGGIWIGDRTLPYGETDGEPGRNAVAAVAPLQSARGSANRNVVSGTGVKYRVNRPHK